MAPGLHTRDPERGSGAGRDLAIRRHRVLQRDQRTTGANPVKVGLIQLPGSRLAHPHRYGYAGVTKSGRALAVDPGAGVRHGSINLADSSRDEGIGTRRGAAVVTARL